MATLPDEADELYALPLEEFTAARDRLAKKLREDGDKAAADGVKALKKPSVPSWPSEPSISCSSGRIPSARPSASMRR